MIFFFWFSIFLAFSHFVDTNNYTKRREFQNKEDKKNSKKMFKRLKMMAKEQLGLKEFKLEQLEIQGWPRFVAIRSSSWSGLALKYLENAIPSMTFKLKTDETKTSCLQDYQIEIYRMLLKKFNECRGDRIGNPCKFIPWNSFYLKGWPNGISLNNTAWAFPDLLEIYHNIDSISWEPMRTDTFTDGLIEYFDIKKQVSDPHADSVPENKRPNIIIDQSEEVEKQYDDEEEDHVVLDFQNQDVADNIPQNEDKFLDYFFDEYTDDHERLDIHCDDLESKRKKMYNRINELAKEQGVNSLTVYDYNEIEGWPRFVGFRPSSWSELALQYLEDALPLMKFNPRNRTNSSHSNSEKQKRSLRVDRVDTTELLLKKYNEGNGHQGIRNNINISWKFCHVKGWPVGVAFDSKLWKYSDLLAIYHNINGISWERVKAGEPSTVTYTDGTTVERVSQKRFIDHENNNTGKRMKMQDDPFKEIESQDYEFNDE